MSRDRRMGAWSTVGFGSRWSSLRSWMPLEKLRSRARRGGRGSNVMRLSQKLLVLGNVVLLVGSVGWLVWQWRSGAVLRDEVAAVRTEAREIARLKVENARRAAGQISDEALKDLRA